VLHLSQKMIASPHARVPCGVKFFLALSKRVYTHSNGQI
jgi:hypothetical protein